MGQSFTTERNGLARKRDRRRVRVLVTGAAGRIGAYFAQHSKGRYDLVLMARESDEGVDQLKRYGNVVIGDLADLEGLKKICRGVDTILHLAADPSPSAVWRDLLENNLIGTYNVFVAAKSAGCARVVFASSIHAVSGYPPDVQVKTSEPVNPGDLYGVSKCFGEAMARYMAEQEGLSAIAVRIGAFQPLEAARKESGISMTDAFVSRRDLNHLLQCCVDVAEVKFAIVHGLSDNRFKRMDISDTRELLGYNPQDDATEENVRLRKLQLRKVSSNNQHGDAQKSGIRRELSRRGVK